MAHARSILSWLILCAACLLPGAALAQESRPPGGSDASISGVVTTADGVTPLADAQVLLIDVTGEPVGFRVTGGDGTYTFNNIPVGSYRVKAERVGYVESYSNGSPSLERAEFLPVTGVNAYHIDFALDLPGGISGMITAADGVTALDSAAVYVYDYASGRSLGLTFTTPDGWYAINYLAPGEYLVKAVSMGSVSAYTGGSFNAESAPPVSVGGGAITQGVDFVMQPAALFTGMVTEADGITPIPRAAVYAYEYGGAEPIAWVESHGDGTFTLPVPAGTYQLTAYQFNHEARDYNSDMTQRAAEPLSIDAGQIRGGMAFALAGVGAVSGSVYQPDGITPAGGVSVLIYDSPNATIHTYSTTTLANGAYSRPVLEGTYYFSAISPAFGTIYYDQKLTLQASDAVSVPPNTQVSAIDMIFFSPADAATLDGTVTFQRSVAKPNIVWSMPLQVTITADGALSPIYSNTVFTDLNGIFSIPGIPPGAYQVRIKQSHALANAIGVTLVTGSNAADLGTLREGDATNDNRVNISDFSLLALAFGKAQGQDGFAPEADFNEDDAVTIADFSLLAANFGSTGAP
ncbi:MAG: carboxypeptidase regulatory-like domain-containing protein [Anaerolineae bacterium]|nr:carboxypeptidase regulatory-like domain-containing protein [Anaerolineae bacterium]